MEIKNEFLSYACSYTLSNNKNLKFWTNITPLFWKEKVEKCINYYNRVTQQFHNEYGVIFKRTAGYWLIKRKHEKGLFFTFNF